jgi:hypothetical protein
VTALTSPIETLRLPQRGFKVVNPLEDSCWDQSVLTHSGASVFHSAGWARVLSSTYGHRPTYLLNYQRGCLNALTPAMEVRSWVSGRRGVSLPFTDFCDPLLGAETEFTDAFQAAVSLGKSRRWRYFEIRIGSEITGFERPALEFLGHAIELNRSEQAIFSGINSTLRNEIRKAERLCVEVILATDMTAMTLYYQLHCVTRKRHGLPPQPLSFFSSIQEHLVSKGLGVVALAFLKPGPKGAESAEANVSHAPSSPPVLCRGNCIEMTMDRLPIAGGVFLNFGKRAVYKFGASDESQAKVPAGKLVLWRMIQYLKSQGIETLEMGRTSMGNTGLRRYKVAWGGAERRVRNFKYDLAHDKFVVGKDKVYGWYNRFFNGCPVGLCRLAGRLLYPHLD